MSMSRPEIAVLMLFASALSLGISRPAHAAESYDNCTGVISSIPAVITTPGTWCLKHDLATSLASGSAIEIQTDNVTIDCNDFKLGGLGAGASTQTIGIYSLDRVHETVRHCTIRGFYRGIRLTGVAGGRHLVEDNRFDANTYIGLSVTGIGSVVRRNEVINTGGSTTDTEEIGIYTGLFVDVLDNTITGAVATDGAVGIFSAGSNNGSSFSNSISGNRIRGLHASAPTWGSEYGIQVINDPRSAVHDNSVVGGTSTYRYGVSCDGFSANNSVRKNVLNGLVSAIDGCNDDGGNIVAP
jgi:hypothetical protein